MNIQLFNVTNLKLLIYLKYFNPSYNAAIKNIPIIEYIRPLVVENFHQSNNTVSLVPK
jgi:hypothetical protein